MDNTSSEQREGLSFNRVMPIFVLVFVDVLGLTVILPLLHLYAAAFGATPLQIGLTVAAFPLAQLVGVPMMGALSDRYGRKPLLLISQITTCASFVMLGLAQSLEVVILSRVLDGVFGANLATAQAAISDITDEKNRARGLGLTGAAFGLGFIFGPIASLISLEVTGSLAVPAFSAAFYSFLSILLTVFVFQETLHPDSKKASQARIFTPFVIGRVLRIRGVGIILAILFAEQLVFFGFESLMGLFTLSRLGLLGQANALYFLLIGLILVVVQVRFIGVWTRRYGERKVAIGAMLLLTVGLLLVATTPEQPHPFYIERNTRFDLQEQIRSSTEVILGDLNVTLPDETQRGLGGIVWFLLAIVPLSIGAGLVRPSLNSMITQRVDSHTYGSVLGVSTGFVSLAQAAAPLLGGTIFQAWGASAPFLLGGLTMGALGLLGVLLLRD